MWPTEFDKSWNCFQLQYGSMFPLPATLQNAPPEASYQLHCYSTASGGKVLNGYSNNQQLGQSHPELLLLTKNQKSLST